MEDFFFFVCSSEKQISYEFVKAWVWENNVIYLFIALFYLFIQSS